MKLLCLALLLSACAAEAQDTGTVEAVGAFDDLVIDEAPLEDFMVSFDESVICSPVDGLPTSRHWQCTAKLDPRNCAQIVIKDSQ